MKIASLVGARPQFIKFALVSRALRQKSHIKEILIDTGQHYESNASDVFFDELEIPKADYNLAIASGGHGMQTGRMLESVEEVLLKEKPNWVLVYGDTNSTLAGALAPVKLHIRVAHKVITGILMVMDEWHRLLLSGCWNYINKEESRVKLMYLSFFSI